MSIPEIYTKFNTWSDNQQKICEYKIENTSEQLEQNAEYQKLYNSTSSVFDVNSTSADIYFDSFKASFGVSQKEDTIFDFLADLTNSCLGLKTEENYNNNLVQLGEGELLEKDADGSGELSLDEYIDAELADLGEDATVEEKAMVAAQSHALFQILDEATGASDKNGVLSAQELASYYKNVDRFENGELVEDGTQDGMFTVDDAAGLTQYLLMDMIREENLKVLREFYLDKYAPEE